MQCQDRIDGYEYFYLEHWTRLSFHNWVSSIGIYISRFFIKAIIYRSISYYSTASTSEAAYIIGGISGSDIIAEFKNDMWRLLGKLPKGRQEHGSISLGDETMIIGGGAFGYSSMETEVWNFIDQNYKLINPTLSNMKFHDGIGLYIVPFDFCTP